MCSAAWRLTPCPPHQPYDSTIYFIPGASLPTGRLYTLSEPELKALHEYLDQNLQGGFICPSNMPLSMPVLFGKRKLGELRFCNYYQPLNDIIPRNCYPLHLIPELIA